MQKSKNSTLILQSALLLFIFVSKSNVCAQSFPTAKLDGFVYGSHRIDWDAILIETFFDPVCPDSRDAWPPLKQALQHYGSRVALVVHLLPLPYHDHAFVSSRAIHIVHNLNSSATFEILEWFFKNQEKFYNAPTRNLSRASVVDEIVKSVAEVVGNSYYGAVKSGFNDRKTDLKTRVSFKYSALRGVYGTPTFFLNGFVLPDAGSALDFAGWKAIIDPLIGKKGPKNEDNEKFYNAQTGFCSQYFEICSRRSLGTPILVPWNLSFNGRKTDLKTRVSFKCFERGVWNTYFLPSWISIARYIVRNRFSCLENLYGSNNW